MAGYSSTVKPVVPGPKSIAAQAIAGHPAWGTPAPPVKPPTSIAAQAIAAHPSWNPAGFNQAAAIKAAAPAVPAAATPHPAAAAAPPPPDPRDAAYYNNVAQNQFSANNRINQLNLTGAQDQTALTQALAALSYQQPRDQLSLEERANSQGGLYSSQEGLNQGNLVHQYATKQSADQERYQQQVDAIKQQVAAVRGGIPLYNQGQYEAAVERAIAADQKDPGLGLAGVPPAAAAQPAAAAAAKPASRAAAPPKVQLAKAVAKSNLDARSRTMAQQKQKAAAKKKGKK